MTGKTLYSDFEELRAFGFDIITERTGNDCFYHIAGLEFELAELKLLVDSVQSARFITERKSQSLIKNWNIRLADMKPGSFTVRF